MTDSLHIIGSRQMGGAERFFLRLVDGLNERGHLAMAVTRPGSPVASTVNGATTNFHVAMRNGWDLISMAAIRRLIQRTGASIVQTYMGRATCLTRAPKPSIHVARLGGYYKIRGYYQHADAWVGNTRGICDYLIQQGLPSDAIHHIGNFVEPPIPAPAAETATLRRLLGIPAEAATIFSLGRFIEKKGMGDLLGAFDRLPAYIGDRPLHLVVAGDGPLRDRLRSRTRSAELENRVHWVGWQSDPGPYFDMADLFVCPSRHEPLGNVILEAWSHRLPVVSTKTLGALELIRPDENGLLTDIGDPADLAGRLAGLLREGPDEWERLADAGYATVRRDHDRDTVIAAYLNFYGTLTR